MAQRIPLTQIRLRTQEAVGDHTGDRAEQGPPRTVPPPAGASAGRLLRHSRLFRARRLQQGDNRFIGCLQNFLLAIARFFKRFQVPRLE